MKKAFFCPGKKGPDKGYALAMQLKLLQRALAPWPRRAAPLLAINCGDGRFLSLLWQSGFDVRATEADPKARALARQRPVPGLDIYAAAADHIPFEDDSFDWVTVDLKNDDISGITNVAREALRLAKRGALLTFWNSASAGGRGGSALMGSEKPVSWWKVWKIMRSLHGGRLTSMGALCGPAFTWRRHCRLAFINSPQSFAPICAWCLIRLDLAPLLTGTPLALRLARREEMPEPAMEFSKKFTDLESRKP